MRDMGNHVPCSFQTTPDAPFLKGMNTESTIALDCMGGDFGITVVVPAALKAWVDMVARARLTFRYTENGPQGLLEGKKAYVIIASGGVPVDSAVDFATPYLRHALGFIGITDIDVIAADQLTGRAEESIDAARVRIAELVHTAPRLQSQVA